MRLTIGATFAVLLARAVLMAQPVGAGALAPGEAATTYTDAVGRKITLHGAPARIVSLAPNLTEILDAIGLGGRLVGITDFCRLPATSGSPARVGGIMNPDLEKIVSLRPDLVLAATSGNYIEDADRLKRLGIPVYSCDTPDIEGVFRTIAAVGEVAGAPKAASDLASKLRARVAAVAARVSKLARPRVLFILWGDPLLVPGKGAFITDALERAGAESVTAALAARYAEYDLEQALTARPDVILTVPDNAAFATSMTTKAEWAMVPAVKSRRVHVLDDAILQPGPRLVDAVEEIAALLHPK